MSTQLRLHHRRYARGVATIEFAISVPVLLLLMLATAEVGRVLFQYNTLTKTVRDGARYTASKAAVGSTRVVSITTQVRNETRNLVVTGTTGGSAAPVLPGLAVGNVTVSDAGNGFISVSATYTFVPALASLPGFGFGSAIDLAMPLTATVVMRAL